MQTIRDKKNKVGIEIFLISFLMLFTEIALIRWISTEIRVFAYVNNLVLLACFLGIGFGCYFSRKRTLLSIAAVGLVVLIVSVKLPLLINAEGRLLHFFTDAPVMLSVFTDSIIWFEPKVESILFMTFLGMVSTFTICFIIMTVFFPMGQILGRVLEEHENPIAAYSINVAASILGIWCFNIFSFTYTPPFAWFFLITLVMLAILLYRSKRDLLDYLSVLALLLALSFSFVQKPQYQTTVLWSPYQKLELRPISLDEFGITPGYCITVNNVNYMQLLNLSNAFIEKYPKYYNRRKRDLSQYDIPYKFKEKPDRVLILGAGAGNDVAAALRQGAKKIDAVEIDPGIYRLGLKYHPEKPYTNPKVNLIVDDARSFLKKTDKKYDLVSLGLLDSHVLSSSFNNMQIDNYVYTKESFREIKNLLKDEGVFTVIFCLPRPWVGRRIYKLLEDVFKMPPVAFVIENTPGYGYGGNMFVVAKNPKYLKRIIESDPELNKFISENKVTCARRDSSGKLIEIKLTTDNWPYLYLEKPRIPKMHLSIMAILIVIFVIAKKAMFRRQERLNLHFFFLGAAFLLLEFQNISKSILLFGSTWLVNSFIISGILVLILLANFFVKVFRIDNLRPFYLLLLLSIIGIYVIPLGIFNFLGYWQKSVLVSAFLNLPVFFAGVIFITSFRKAERKDLALGSNFIGSAFGGILESLSFIFGIKALLLLVILFYSLSFVSLYRLRDCK